MECFLNRASPGSFGGLSAGGDLGLVEKPRAKVKNFGILLVVFLAKVPK